MHTTVIYKEYKMFRYNKVFFVLAFAFLIFGLNDSAQAILDGADIPGTVVDFTKDETVGTNTGMLQNNSTTLNGNGFSLDGSKYSNSSNSNSNVWLGNNGTGDNQTGYETKILNIGTFQKGLLPDAGNDIYLKITDNPNSPIAYGILTMNDGVHNFHSKANSNGGGFLYTISNLTVENTIFKGNYNNSTSSGAAGGAIKYMNNTSAVPVANIKNSYFTENHRSSTGSNTVEGGAIWSQQSNGTLVIDDSIFTKNYAQHTPTSSSSNFARGGVIANTSGALKISNSYFGNNYVKGSSAQSGAIYAGSSTSAPNDDTIYHTIDKTVFEKNSAIAERSGANAGAFSSSNNTKITNSLFLSNSAVLDLKYAPSSNFFMGAGAISQGDTTTSRNTRLEVLNTVFKNNFTQLNNDSNIEIAKGGNILGGAIRINNSTTKFDNVLLQGNYVENKNTASDIIAAGGAIAINPTTTGRGTHSFTAQFNENKVISQGTALGGAVAILDGKNTGYIPTVDFNNAALTNNSVESAGNFSTGAKGGAIYAGVLSFVNINDSTVESNETKTTGNTNANHGGGAVFVTDRAVLTAVDTSFVNNNASGTGAKGGAIYNEKKGVTNIIAQNKNVFFTGNKADGVSNAIHNEEILNLNAADDKSIVFNDRISSTDKSTIYINKKGEWDKVTYKYTAEARRPKDAPTTGTIVLNENMEDIRGAVELHGGTLALGENGTFFNNASAFAVHGASTLNLANGKVQTHNLGDFTLNAPLNLAIDADLANQGIDNFIAKSVSVSGDDSIININRVNLINDTFEGNSINLKLTENEELMDIITLDESVKTALGEIYKYDIEYENINDGIIVTKRGSTPGGDSELPAPPPAVYDNFNPAVMVGAIAAQAGYMTQLNAYDNAFQNTVSNMMLPKIQRHASLFQNRYAISDGGYQYNEENAHTWFRPYTSIEKVSFKNGPDVDNIMYGTFIGTDGKLYQLKNGKIAQLSAYLSYNGSHQSFDGNSLYQNGGTLGVVGSLYKDNFFTVLTANAGASSVSASTMYGTDKFPMLMSGIASKTGYNLEFLGGRYVLQPNLLLSYSLINAFNYTNARGLKIESDPLHAIQVSPGARFFANTNSGWQPYLSADMKWNILDDSKFTAADVALPEVSIKPYVEYGLGVQKITGDNIFGYMQALVRNGGRTGIALSAGLDILLGKDELKNYRPHL